MRSIMAVIAFFAFSAPSAAVAPSAQPASTPAATTFHATFLCRLSDHLCHSVYRELGRLVDARLKDLQRYRRYPLEQRIELTASRDFARLQKRLTSLRKDVGDEVLRLHLCAAKDRLATARGAPYSTDCNKLHTR